MENWYKMDSEAVLKELDTDQHTGLTAQEAQARQTIYGLNQFEEAKKEGLVLQILQIRLDKLGKVISTLKDNVQLPISAAAMILFMASLVGIPPVANFMGFMPLDGYHWLIAIGLSLVPLMVAEYSKFWDNHKFHSLEKTRVIFQQSG